MRNRLSGAVVTGACALLLTSMAAPSCDGEGNTGGGGDGTTTAVTSTTTGSMVTTTGGGGGGATCGGFQQECCAGEACNEGYTCTAGTCVQAPIGEYGKPCTKNSDCLSGLCLPLDGASVCTDTCTEASSCPPGWTCGPFPGQAGNLCQCNPMPEVCNGEDDDCNGIVDDKPATDLDCEDQSGPFHACEAGTCECAETLCGQSCVDTSTDWHNCGSCGSLCIGGTCAGGQCMCPPEAATLCDDTCVDLASNAYNWGACGNDISWADWPMPNPASAGLPNPASYTVSAGGKVVTDNVTGLMWQRQDTSTPLDWAGANTACADLVLEGFDDWRVPTRIELASLVDFTKDLPAIDGAAFPNTVQKKYWTLSRSWDSPFSAFVVDFKHGQTLFLMKDELASVRCVR